jgi:signal transduction histidine kinase
VVIAGYLACLVLQAPTYLFAPAGPLQIADRPDLVDAGRQALRIGYFLVVLGVGLILVRRLRAATPAQRRVLAPLTVYGLIAAAAIPLGSVLVDLHVLFPDRGVGLFVVQILLVTGVPIAFAIGVLRGGFARTADIDELGVWLGADDESGRPALLDALAAALGDNSVELRFRVPGDAGWVTADGMPAPAPTASTLRGVEKVERAGVTIGAVLYDATQQTRPEEVRSAARVIALALDRERLTVELRASRTRLVEASDAERRRIARDLHDGLQSRLVLLAIQAGLADDRSMRSGLDAAIEELRSLVDGVMPAELTERGLPAAVEGLTDRMPVAVTLEIDALEQRLPLAVESTGFFVVSEALVNAVKHAQASELIVSLHRDGGDRLRIEVGDNGVGGADRGNGIRSMTDRVEALGGRLLIESAVGAGTRVRAELPCGS